MKVLMSVLVLCSSFMATPAFARDGENAAVIGGIIGGIIGGAIGGGAPGHHRPHPHPGYPGRPHPYPGYPGRPGPGPGFPVANLCFGTFTDGFRTALTLNNQGNGQVVFVLNGPNGYYEGYGTCYQNSPTTAQFQFSMFFSGGQHYNNGQIVLGADGRAYMQGRQDAGPIYSFVR